MEQLETLRLWLQSWPGWEEMVLRLDGLEQRPGCAGLYPQGLEQRQWQKDLQGNVLCRLRLHLRLRLCTEDPEGWAGKLLRLQQWIMTERPPVLGCLPQQEQVAAQKGRLVKSAGPGLWLYELPLWADYTVYREVRYDDESL